MLSDQHGMFSNTLHGLPCRADQACRFTAEVLSNNSMEAMTQAASQRNGHELRVHGYVHAYIPTTPAYAYGFTREGRSTLKRKRAHA